MAKPKRENVQKYSGSMDEVLYNNFTTACKRSGISFNKGIEILVQEKTGIKDESFSIESWLKQSGKRVKIQVEFFELILNAIKRKMKNDINAHNSFQWFIGEIDKHISILENRKKEFENYDALKMECESIYELKDHLASKDQASVWGWFSTYKKSSCIYEVLKSQGLSDSQINVLQDQIKEMKKRNFKNV